MKSPAPVQSTSSNIDAQNRHVAQQAGLDQDLESQVPPRYGSFTVTTLGVILVLLITMLIWIMI
jgi:hypothetical protein